MHAALRDVMWSREKTDKDRMSWRRARAECWRWGRRGPRVGGPELLKGARGSPHDDSEQDFNSHSDLQTELADLCSKVEIFWTFQRIGDRKHILIPLVGWADSIVEDNHQVQPICKQPHLAL
ncbi:hypothetical protein AXG93_1962s1500 [Marchantia polymorpha subsp. ruderalis]|uniref:Uncharacterized protein n=1 Tax=Marchantia polymorpha subsp. ruderalis TaxID=1480154 RepID=A0A176WF78_MARPO|nr:hypothetical protein AXG93_1962s1500 [Marchantia polymorpha subsp. ruderalis]